MATLVCLGLGYCARHYVTAFGHRFERIVGTGRDVAEPRTRVGSFDVERLGFDGNVAGEAVATAVVSADALLISAAPDQRGDPVLVGLAAALAQAAPRCVVYLSTVGVYGDHAGDWVDETTPPRPVSERSRERLAAEQAWQRYGEAHGIPVAVLRLAGIYGPGQNALLNVAAGRARIIDKPGQVFNRIHVADIAQAVDACFAAGASGVFNLADDEPSPPADPILYAAELLEAAPPPVIAFAVAAASMTPMALSFYGESKRVRNTKLKHALGVALRYPTYREGLRALLPEATT